MRAFAGIVIFLILLNLLGGASLAREQDGYSAKLIVAEVGLGVAGGAGGFITGVAIGNLVYETTPQHAGGGLVGGMVGWCVGGSLGVYFAGEYLGDDSANDPLTFGATLGAGLSLLVLGTLLDIGPLTTWGTLISPLVSLITYNLVKRPAPIEEVMGQVKERTIMVPIISFTF